MVEGIKEEEPPKVINRQKLELLSKPRQTEQKKEPATVEKFQKSDKYLLNKFKKEFEEAGRYVFPEEKVPAYLDYLLYKDFMVNMGVLNVTQASTECRESALLYDIWFSLG